MVLVTFRFYILIPEVFVIGVIDFNIGKRVCVILIPSWPCKSRPWIGLNPSATTVFFARCIFRSLNWTRVFKIPHVLTVSFWNDLFLVCFLWSLSMSTVLYKKFRERKIDYSTSTSWIKEQIAFCVYDCTILRNNSMISLLSSIAT